MDTECEIPYDKVIKKSNDIFVGMDDKYVYLFANQSFLRYAGLRESNVIGHTAPEVLGEQIFTRNVKPYIDRSFNGKMATFTLPFTPFKLGTRYLHLKCYPIQTAERMMVVVVGRDVTSLERSRNKLQWYKQTYRTLMNRATDVLILVSPEGIINACSKYVHRKTGLSSEAVVGQSLEKLLTPQSYRTVVKHLEAWQTKRAGSLRWEAELLGCDGREIPFEVHSTPIYEKGKLEQVIAIARDVSDHKHKIESLTKRCLDLESKLQEVLQGHEDKLRRIEEESRQIRQSLLEAQETERNRIGAELHDEIGGYLTILKMYFTKIIKEPKDRASVAQFREIFDEMVEHMRSLSHDLYPALLKREGLLPALEAYLTRFERATGIRTSFRPSGIHERLSFNIEVASYRIIQEALDNAAKHSGAETIDIELSQTHGTIKICVEDNGKGFDVSKMGNSGLFMMKARTLDSGGNFLVESSPGRGTRVICTLLPPWNAILEDNLSF